MYFFWRHNVYCEPGIYSVFSLCEYIVILSNMAYHATSYYDFYHVNINLSSLVWSQGFHIVREYLILT